MRALAGELGPYTPMALYSYVGHKDGLYLAVMRAQRGFDRFAFVGLISSALPPGPY
jgi:hypothetical protein